MIPQDLAQRYVVKSRTPLSEWFPTLVQLLRRLTNKSWGKSHNYSIELYVQVYMYHLILHMVLYDSSLPL